MGIYRYLYKTTRLQFYPRLTISKGHIALVIGIGLIINAGYNTLVSKDDLLSTIGAPSNFTNNLFPKTYVSPSHVIEHGSRKKKEIALTFDADMNEWMRYELLSGHVKSWYDQTIVTTLIKTKTPATFFLTGMWIELYPKETQAIGLYPLFELGNHSYSHPSFGGYCYGLHQIEEKNVKEEVIKTQKLLKDIVGINSHFFRFPGGCYTEKNIYFIEDLGLQVVHWDVISGDAFNNDPASIIKTVLDRVTNGSIIIMHLNGPPNAPMTSSALPVIINELKTEGYTFVKISELLGNS